MKVKALSSVCNFQDIILTNEFNLFVLYLFHISAKYEIGGIALIMLVEMIIERDENTYIMYR